MGRPSGIARRNVFPAGQALPRLGHGVSAVLPDAGCRTVRCRSWPPRGGMSGRLQRTLKEEIMETTEQVQQRRVRRRTSRRSFLTQDAAVGVGPVGEGWLLTDASPPSATVRLTQCDPA